MIREQTQVKRVYRKCVLIVFCTLFQLLTALRAGDVNGVKKALIIKDLNINAQIGNRTAAEWLVCKECRADWVQKMEIAFLLSGAGAAVDFQILVCAHT